MGMKGAVQRGGIHHYRLGTLLLKACVKSAWTRLEHGVQESELEGCTSLRHVLVGGEALPPVLAPRFGQRLPNAHLHNAYGPTETTVDATGAHFSHWWESSLPDMQTSDTA